MQENKTVKIKTMDIDMASIISKNSAENLKAFLRRIELPFEENWGKDLLALTLKEAILEHPEYILYIHSMEALLFLTELWDFEEMEISRADWALIGQLQLLGFLDYTMNKDPDQEGYVYLSKEAKEAFYFYLKSKRSRQEMERYELWERLIRGMMTYYGIISFNRLYLYLCKCLKSPVDDSEFHKFLAARVSLWSFGSLVLEKNSGIEYYENFEVTDPEQVLDICESHKEMDYWMPNLEEALYVADNNGFGQWKGIPELADIFMDQLNIEYYQTVVILKSCILLIQNGDSSERVLEDIMKWCLEASTYRNEIYKTVKMLYQSVPVYELKGWSRKEQKDHFVNNKKIFTVLKGGKPKKK